MKQRKSIDELIQSGLDGELNADERDVLDQHLRSHPEDAEQYRKLQHQSKLLDEAVPKPSEEHLRSLRARAETTAHRMSAYRIAASAAIFAAGLGLGYLLPHGSAAPSGNLEVFAEQARAAHALYVTEVLHPVEVAASERNHLQTWLSNRLGAAIIAPHLGETGFALIGGRLLPAGDKPSALFMYENANGDRLSLLATYQDSDQRQSFRFHEAGGYLTVFWQDGPWRYSLVGALDREPLDKIARTIHGQLL